MDFNGTGTYDFTGGYEAGKLGSVSSLMSFDRIDIHRYT